MPPPNEYPLAVVLSRLARSRDDEEAWQQLYVRVWPFVVGLNYHFLRGVNHMVEDASQEVFLRLLQYCRFDGLQQPTAFFAYVRIVCMNVSRDFLSELAKRSETGLLPSIVEQLPGFITEDFTSQVKNIEAQDALKAILDHLNQDEQHFVKLAIKGYSLSEIAKLEGLTYSNAGVRMHRLRRKLKEALVPKQHRE
jgi:RNA polymerase sigma factor (sigma-70 family)